MGGFYHCIADEKITLVGVEAAGCGLTSGRSAATMALGRPGILHGSRTVFMQTSDGQVEEAHSISAGLDYPGVGPEHSFLKDVGRAIYLTATDDEAIAAFQLCATLEGILPALEPAHALARVGEIARDVGPGGIVVMNLCGRGDKDIFTIAERLEARL